jgi:hypothetical protein
VIATGLFFANPVEITMYLFALTFPLGLGVYIALFSQRRGV